MAPKTAFAVALAATSVSAFPWVASQDGVDSSLLRPRNLEARTGNGGLPGTCPFNAKHPGAAPITDKYPYCSAKNGLPGKFPCTNNVVPAPGDTAHAFTAPGPNDIRGPCPGINTAANHNFLSHDGITTFTELVDMQQNLYGVGWDLAVLLATLGVGLDGDVVTGKLSIGCDATSRTATLPLGAQPGLDGHNKFEGDSSLTRNDYFLANGDNHDFNGTLFKQMSDVAKGSYDFKAMADYRYKRYQDSRRDNANFYFGPKSLLLFGAASFLYELMPSGDNGPPDEATITSFFGAKKQSDGSYTFNNAERIPDNWKSRSQPYTIPLVAAEIGKQYFAHPVEFGGNIGKGDFVGIGSMGPSISKNLLTGADPAVAQCLLYQVATENVPSSLGGGGTNILSDLSSQVLGFMKDKIKSIPAPPSGCPIDFNN